ncbi:gluconolaconase [Pseudoxanthomonas kalamensis DSM 18571]|uniref:gluconolaconase n=1 Tax=Pseudoxanthomonas kalamensis TaxID=289483 RepID=UPI001390AC43|nr:gluconolaconase [Pseudoxanthomonas kalamensis]KAF1712700.1 gluconolaconase [Pseudoxanthomonas kalamensis DSM 18571]
MSRKTWLWTVTALTAVALAATYIYERTRPSPVEGPPPTPFGWLAQLQLEAGDGVGGWRDGAALQARFDDPWGLALAADGSLYVADAGDNNRIRRIAVDGNVTTLAGGGEGFVDGSGAAARFNTPSGLALDAAGNLYVADTGNHAIRKVSPDDIVTTLAGDGQPGERDGIGAQARFNGPMGVAVDAVGNVYVADTYNDRIRRIDAQGRVSTMAGGGGPGQWDGIGAEARFDTPTALTLDADGNLWVADTGNSTLRRIAAGDGWAGTPFLPPLDGPPLVRRPLGLVLTEDGTIYASEMSGRVVQISRSGVRHELIGAEPSQRLSRPAGLVLAVDGSLRVADAGSHRVHRIVPTTDAAAAVPVVGPSIDDPLPDTGGRWPLAPQNGWHEVVGTLGEVRGNYRGDSRDHLHAGLDIRGDVGATVLAIADGKVDSPLAARSAGSLNEGFAIADLDYIHMRVGRDPAGRVLDPSRFHAQYDEDGRLRRIRVPRGTRFRAGDALGTINGMAHVHLQVGASGFQRNAVQLGFVGYADRQPPRIVAVELSDADGQPLPKNTDGRIVVPRDAGVQIVVEAWDQVDDNLPRRRLGLYAAGYQLLDANGAAAPGYASPRMSIVFDRMPADPDAVMLAYAPDSGITVHGSASTRFRYVLSNTVHNGEVAAGYWRPGELPPGEYTLRIVARDYSGNEAQAGRDVGLVLE